MIDLGWLSDQLCAVLRWQLDNPGAGDRDDAPEVPIAGRRVWSIFLALSAERGAGMAGPNPVTSADIAAWSALHREPVRPFELDILGDIDLAYMTAARAAQSKTSETHIESRPMSQSLFDAMFKGDPETDAAIDAPLAAASPSSSTTIPAAE